MNKYVKGSLFAAVSVMLMVWQAGSFAALLPNLPGGQTQTPGGTTSTSGATAPITTPPIVTYQPAGSAISVAPVKAADVKLKSGSITGVSASVTNANYTANLKPCPTTFICPDINNKMPNGSVANPASVQLTCPDTCIVTRGETGWNAATQAPTATTEAICPGGYVQVGAFNVQKEYGKDNRSFDEPYPIPDMSTYAGYVAAGDTCWLTSDVMADNIMTYCGNQGDYSNTTCRAWKTEQQCMYGYCYPVQTCTDYYAANNGYISWRNLYTSNSGVQQWVGNLDDGRPYAAVGALEPDGWHSCDLAKNQLNAQSGKLCEKQVWDGVPGDYIYTQISYESRNGMNTYFGSGQSMYMQSGNGSNLEYGSYKRILNTRYGGCYTSLDGGCKGGWSCTAGSVRKNFSVVVYAKCHHNPGSGLAWTGNYIPASIICSRLKPAWQ